MHLSLRREVLQYTLSTSDGTAIASTVTEETF